MRVSAAEAGIGPAAVVTVDVAGLSPTQPGTVTVTADRLAASLNLDPRCDLRRRQHGHLPGGRRDGSLQMLAVGLALLSPTTLTITAAPGAGLHDPSTGRQHRRSVTLG